MSTDKDRRILTTIPPFVWWVSDKIEARKRKKRAKAGTDAIDNIERLFRLKERAAISDADFDELKEKLKKQI